VDVTSVGTLLRIELIQKARLVLIMIKLWKIISLMPLFTILRRNKLVIQIRPVDIEPFDGKLINAHIALLADLIQLDIVVVTGVLI